MNFYDKLNELSSTLKNTDEYKQYLNLKNKIKADDKTYSMLKKFKDKQKEHQIRILNGKEVIKKEQDEMENIYSILIQNEDVRALLENEMKINIYLADMQKVMGETIKEVVDF